MLQKYKFTLTCTSKGLMRGQGGEALHGMLFCLLKVFNPDMTSRLHDTVEKPFSLSPLYGPGKRRNEELHCQKGEECHFYLCCLNEEMCGAVEIMAREWRGKKLQLGTAAFTGKTVEEISPGGFNYSDLMFMPPLEGEIVFSFLSPTSFRSQGRQVLFPLPEKVFSSLQRRWNAFSPVKLAEDTDFSFMIVSRYNLRTTLVPFGKYKIIGFTGNCHYRISRDHARIMKSRVSTLARFAEFAGCGYKTSMSLGQVKLEENQRKRKCSQSET